MKRVFFLLLMMWAAVCNAQVQAPKGFKVGSTVIDANEVKRLDGVTSDIQTQLNNKYDKSEAVSAKTYFYTKTQIDSILNAKYGSLKLTGSKLTYTESGKKYIAKTDSVENLGTELVANGTFSSDTEWYDGYDRFTITGGVAQVNTGSATYGAFLYQDIVISAGKTYKVELDVSAYSSGNFVVGLNDKGDGPQSTIINSTGHYIFYLTSNMDEPKQVMLQSWNLPFVGSIDNISVREVL